jgi:hypothetical protein
MGSAVVVMEEVHAEHSDTALLKHCEDSVRGLLQIVVDACTEAAGTDRCEAIPHKPLRIPIMRHRPLFLCSDSE